MQQALSKVPARCPVKGCPKARLMPADFSGSAESVKQLEQIILPQLSDPQKFGIVMCPTCHGGVLPVPTQPVTLGSDSVDAIPACTSCGTRACFHCGLAHDPWHKGRSCEGAAYAKKLGSSWANIVDTLLDGGKSFLQTEWTGMSDPVKKFTVNPHLYDPTSPSVKCFQAALQKHGGHTPGYFGWHGTATTDAVKAIAKTNLDTGRRSGQVHGPGEYFGIKPSTSASYDGCNNMLLFWAIDAANITKVQGTYAYVVNNPSNDCMYCIPVGIVTYGSGTPIDFPYVPGAPTTAV